MRSSNTAVAEVLVTAMFSYRSLFSHACHATHTRHGLSQHPVEANEMQTLTCVANQAQRCVSVPFFVWSGLDKSRLGLQPCGGGGGGGGGLCTQYTTEPSILRADLVEWEREDTGNINVRAVCNATCTGS